jgi:hypothetical protein
MSLHQLFVILAWVQCVTRCHTSRRLLVSECPALNCSRVTAWCGSSLCGVSAAAGATCAQRMRAASGCTLQPWCRTCVLHSGSCMPQIQLHRHAAQQRWQAAALEVCKHIANISLCWQGQRCLPPVKWDALCQPRLVKLDALCQPRLW